MNLWSTFLELDTLYESVLSDEQKVFFKNSKIRDSQGNLMTFYHGTNKDFSVFDSKSIGPGGPLGTGYYFSSRSGTGKVYGKVKAVYLNIKNPMVFETAKQPRDFLVAMGKKYNLNLSDAAKEGKSLNYKITELLQNDGYDGVLCYFTQLDEYWCVAYSPEQIKSIDNLSPTVSANMNEGIFDEVPTNRSHWKTFSGSAVTLPASSNSKTMTNSVIKTQASPQHITEKPIVEIVYDNTARKLRARADDGIHGEANVAFPNALRIRSGMQYEVDELIWNGKNYRVAGKITLINNTASSQNINKNINEENIKMNFTNAFEELSSLYESDKLSVETETEVATLEESAEVEIVDDEEVEDVIDDEAPVEEPETDEPKQVILECAKCGALVIKDEAAIASDEETELVNLDEQCTFCEETAGYKIIGAVVPYKASEDINEELKELLDIDLPISADVNIKADGNNVNVGSMGV